MAKRTKKLTLDDVRKLYAVHGTATRDHACELLAGDPVQADAVTRRVFQSMVGMELEVVAPAEKLPAWIADQVVRRCLEQTGNHEVADWADYVERHPEEKPKKQRAPRAPSHVIPLRPGAPKKAQATRRAREALEAGDSEEPRRPEGRVEGPSGPEVKP